MSQRFVLGLVVVIAIGLAVLGWKRCASSDTKTTSVATVSSVASGTGPRINAIQTRTRLPDPRTLSRGSIRGTIRSVDAASNVATALPGALVCLSRSDDDVSGQTTLEPMCSVSGTNGAYSFAQLIPGSWRLSASASEHFPYQWEGPPPDETNSIRLAAAEAKSDIDLALPRGGVAVHGIVSDINGGPVGGAYVELRSGWDSKAFSVRSADNGTFTAWAKAGEVSASATADGYASGSAQGVAPTAMLEVLLAPESILAGIVVDRDSQAPVEGAHVSASTDWTDGGGSGNDITDSQGRFRITRLASGRYKPEAYLPGGYGTSQNSVMLGLGETVENVRIELHKTAVATGRVVIDDGTGKVQPCPPDRCQVSLRNRAAGHEESSTTHDDGKVIFETMLPGTYNVSLWSRDYLREQSYPDVVIVEADINGLEWKMTSGGELVGLVRTTSGEPVPLASISARTVGGVPRGQESGAYDTAKSDGTFRIRGLAPGTYELDVNADAYPSPDPKPRTSVDLGTTANVEIILVAGGDLDGVVVDTHGKGVPNAYVWLRGDKWGNNSARSEDNGAFHITGITPGSYRVGASRDGSGAMRRPGTTDDDVQGERVLVTAHEAANVRLMVEAQDGTIRGTVVGADGEPVADAYLSTQRESDSAGAATGGATQRTRWRWDSKPVVTDPSGAFVLTELAPGSYTVRAYRRGGGEAIAEHVAVGSTAQLVIKATGSIAGVVDTAGLVVENLTINVRSDKVGFRRGETFFRSDGAFSLAELPAGEFLVRAVGGGGEAETRVTLAEGQALTGIRLTMTPKVRLRGRLIDLADGTPVPGISMSAKRTTAVGANNMMLDGEMRASGAEAKLRITDVDGRFEIDQAPTGAVTISGFPRDWRNSDYGILRYPTQVASTGAVVDLGELTLPKTRVKLGDIGGDLGFDTKQAVPGTMPENTVLEVSIVRPGGPASGSGLKVGDVIVSTDGIDVRGRNQYLTYSLWAVPVSTTVTLGLADGRTVKITAAPQP